MTPDQYAALARLRERLQEAEDALTAALESVAQCRKDINDLCGFPQERDYQFPINANYHN